MRLQDHLSTIRALARGSRRLGLHAARRRLTGVVSCGLVPALVVAVASTPHARTCSLGTLLQQKQGRRPFSVH
jgi:hypothetical protein